MRTPLVFAACILLFAGACGGKTTGAPGAGSSSGGGSGSGAGSGGSSGGSGAGSGGGSGGISGSSSGGTPGTCEPLPGCSSTTMCLAPDGCNECECGDDSGWICTGHTCPSDGGIATDGSAGSCPPTSPGETCGPDGAGCGYDDGNGCFVSCTCEGVWTCSESCTASACPANPPQSGDSCGASNPGALCDYEIAACGLYECSCDQTDTWDCFESCGGPTDAGPPDEGPPDSGFADAGGPCPEQQPAQSSACPENGILCSYDACPTNCLCSDGAWACAKEPGCP